MTLRTTTTSASPDMQHYIREQNSDLGELAYHGPFEESEMQERLNDAYADLLASGLANLDDVLLSEAEAVRMYINPREFWMTQLADLTKESSNA
ncbi:MAG: hypothetical protein JWO15_3517 [Sphingomonadales bacterium]|nr:hypothetical protein [Sphingomonadales bacterium]